MTALSEQHLDIINSACALLGADPVQNLDADVGGAGAASLLYKRVVDFNLGIYLFGFSKQVFSLSVIDGPPPATGYSFSFDLPPEAIELPLYLTDNPKDRMRRFNDYALVDGRVHADRNPL